VEISANLTPIVTPASSNELQPAQFGTPKSYTLAVSSASIDIQHFQDTAELNNRVVTIARLFNMSIEDLLRGGHIVVFEGHPAKLTEPAPVAEVLRVD
jgi:hypothetical protein